MTGCKFSAEYKMSIILQGIKGEMSVAELCRNHSISQSQFYKWRSLFLEGAKESLSNKTRLNQSGILII